MIDLFTKIAERIRLSAAELKFRFRELIGRLTGRSARANDYGKGIFYIRGSDVLPPPLSPEEERKLTQRLTEQDSEARSTLIEHNLRLVVYIAKRFDSGSANVEDLISIGTIGLIKAVNTFDPSKNIKLATYASRCIENEILMYLRRTGKTKSEISFDEPLNVDWDGNELLLSDILGTEEDVIFGGIEEEVNRDLLNSALRKLDQREKRIVEMRFGLISGCEMTQKEVADYMGISQSYISRLEKKIISRLRREIKKMG
ncbi:MAG: RNA polymerase sporulation sigma factor SigE [Anaerovoracaceae bacterium]